MSATWFVADTHFGHAKVAELRGFRSPEEHDEAITKRWNRQVRPDDLVWVLGDISGGSRTSEAHALGIIKTLPGIKHLIAGNHDSASSIHREAYKRLPLYRDIFETVQQFARIRVEGQNVLLSHYPYGWLGDGTEREGSRYTQYRLPDEGLRLIHGHTHQSEPFTDRQMCVSWESWRRLVSLGDVAKWIKDTPPETFEERVE